MNLGQAIGIAIMLLIIISNLNRIDAKLDKIIKRGEK
jgi:hypothetical protein